MGANMKVLIIGAGILGASTAYHLARKGIDVEIIDAQHEGKATLAGAGIVCPWATKLEDGAFLRHVCGRCRLLHNVSGRAQLLWRN
jgi:glycine/D-amino acid oxidase-like deaminating enzyme